MPPHEAGVAPVCASIAQLEMWRLEYKNRAKDLWETDYNVLLQREEHEDEVLWEATSLVFTSQTSTYRQRMKDERLARRYDAKASKQIRDTVAVLRRRRNAHVVPFSIMARSLSYFNQRVPERVWADQCRALRIGMGGHAQECTLHIPALHTIRCG
jgi:hypothetical protein